MDGTRLRTLHATTDGQTGEVGDDQMRDLVGRVLDRRYRLDEIAGAGAMGVVFRATHTLIGRSFAIKVLRREHLDSGDVARRFLLEARVASSIKHPNVVDISDFGELPEGGAYYVMEMLEGCSLAHAIDVGGAMSPGDAGLIGLQIANGLAAAHAMGVVHRDLKADNVFLCSPRRGVSHSLVKLLDFGIARVGGRRITVAGSVLGTPEYMSPEMALGRDVDHRADLYALGIILFELLTGTVPFYHKEIARTLEMHMQAPRPTLASRRAELASLPSLSALVASLMAVDREERPSSADAVARILTGALEHDLDRAAAAAVQRATLAIGSNLLPEVADPSKPAVWPAAQGWPAPAARPPVAASIAVADAGVARTTDPARAATVVVHPPVARRSMARATFAAVGAAAVAGGLTFGVFRWTRSGPRPVASGSAAPESLELPAAAAAAAVGVGPTVEVIPAAVIAELPAPMPTAISATPRDTSEVRPPATVERNKVRRRKNGSAELTPNTEPGSSTPVQEPVSAPKKPAADPAPVKRVDPVSDSVDDGTRDLKDPFPTK